jgi:hypothetical protein
MKDLQEATDRLIATVKLFEWVVDKFIEQGKKQRKEKKHV